ncbi:DUF2207 domain-containing protein [Cryobacterium sp. TMT2-10]|uniref:DUF2207 domain-containing protein n=1 Tax=Cryobacterium shii TaxID=1259235 RepID=A0AAQ2C9I5_9MICO|nr:MULTISPECIES: DUF2207 domain-containing protein [Cryobacterium]TFC52919.1 DUF2207 domain-containing protein [Cryobacterium shii]TFD18832.1 DUF2207 domain-containing protein [Cryobacterium sp. TMT4-10]TFD21962.1 DUF2207 domain-containing protein [Cryobacterium sp. TMT2-23]TFD43193.1 DUF2207 domain-containing protein [Cryobacterium sp. TMT2-10]
MQPTADAETSLIIILSAVSLLGVAAAYLRRRFGQRGAAGRGAVIARYEVPTGYNLLEAADLVNRPTTAVAAQLVSLAVRGKVRILAFPVSAGGGAYTLQLLTVKGVHTLERQLLEALFPGLAVGGVRELGVTDRALAAQLRSCPRAARDLVTARGWRALMVGRGGKLIVIVMAAVLLPTLVIFGAVVQSAGSGQLGKVVPFVGIAAICIYLANRFAAATPQLTEAGAEQRDHLKGLKIFLGLAQADRVRLVQSADDAPPAVKTDAAGAPDTVELVRLSEKLLPFAVLWGVERDWARELVVLYEQGAPKPGWLMLQGDFSATAFNAAVTGLIGSVAKSATLPGGSPASR